MTLHAASGETTLVFQGTATDPLNVDGMQGRLTLDGLQPQMAVERDRRLSGETLELPAQRALGRTGSGSDFAGCERSAEVALHNRMAIATPRGAVLKALIDTSVGPVDCFIRYCRKTGPVRRVSDIPTFWVGKPVPACDGFRHPDVPQRRQDRGWARAAVFRNCPPRSPVAGCPGSSEWLDHGELRERC
jgi:hypothetical protein